MPIQEITCLFCGKTFLDYVCPSSKRKYCSHSCYRQAHDKNKTRYVAKNHNGKLVAVHRIVMEEHLGRPLLPTEDVHHINGNGRDNRIENLVVLTHSEHLRFEMLQKTPEEWKKIAAKRVGLKRSPETKAKMSQARKRWFQKKSGG